MNDLHKIEAELQRLNFSEEICERILKELTHSGSLKIESLNTTSNSEIMYDDILNKKVLLHNKDKDYVFDNGSKLTIRIDNIGPWACFSKRLSDGTSTSESWTGTVGEK